MNNLRLTEFCFGRLGSCCHLFCSKHLDGGGIPFHRSGESPKTACPECSATGDISKKTLFGVRGFEPAQHDTSIPSDWFQTPPIAWTAQTKGTEAMRANGYPLACRPRLRADGSQFQYISLCRFGDRTLKRARELEGKLLEANRKLEDESKKQPTFDMELETLRRRVAELQHCEVELRPWKTRETLIKHYLGLFTEITR